MYLTLKISDRTLQNCEMKFPSQLYFTPPAEVTKFCNLELLCLFKNLITLTGTLFNFTCFF